MALFQTKLKVNFQNNNQQIKLNWSLFWTSSKRSKKQFCNMAHLNQKKPQMETNKTQDFYLTIRPPNPMFQPILPYHQPFQTLQHH